MKNLVRLRWSSFSAIIEVESDKEHEKANCSNFNHLWTLMMIKIKWCPKRKEAKILWYVSFFLSFIFSGTIGFEPTLIDFKLSQTKWVILFVISFASSLGDVIACHNLNGMKFSTREAEQRPIEVAASQASLSVRFLFLSNEIEKVSGLVMTHREGSPGLFSHLLSTQFVH